MTKRKTPKGRILKDLDEPVTSIDGEFIWRSKETIMGAAILERDDDGRPLENQILPEEPLTRRKAINLALAKELKTEDCDAEAKLRAGYLQRMFWKDKEIELDADDIIFIRNRLNYRFNGTVFFYMCEYLEGVTA